MKVQLKHRTVLPAIIQFRIISLYFRCSRHNICQTILNEEGSEGKVVGLVLVLLRRSDPVTGDAIHRKVHFVASFSPNIKVKPNFNL